MRHEAYRRLALRPSLLGFPTHDQRLMSYPYPHWANPSLRRTWRRLNRTVFMTWDATREVEGGRTGECGQTSTTLPDRLPAALGGIAEKCGLVRDILLVSDNYLYLATLSIADSTGVCSGISNRFGEEWAPRKRPTPVEAPNPGPSRPKRPPSDQRRPRRRLLRRRSQRSPPLRKSLVARHGRGSCPSICSPSTARSRSGKSPSIRW